MGEMGCVPASELRGSAAASEQVDAWPQTGSWTGTCRDVDRHSTPTALLPCSLAIPTGSRSDATKVAVALQPTVCAGFGIRVAARRLCPFAYPFPRPTTPLPGGRTAKDAKHAKERCFTPPESVTSVADSQDGVAFVGGMASSDLDRRSATGKEWKAGYRALKRQATFERSRCDLEGNCVPGGRRMGAGR